MARNPFLELFDNPAPDIPGTFWATVTATNPLRVKRDAEPVLPVTPQTLETLAVGDRVLCLWERRQVIVLGKMGGSGVPAGSMMAWASASNPPIGWFLCRGQSLSRTQYPELFAAIGTQYGGSGTTFNLPDMRARVPYGYSGSGIASAMGATGGAETHTLTVAQMPSHNHGGSTGSSQVQRRTSGYVGEGNPSGATASYFGADAYRTTVNDSYTAHTHSVSSQGGGAAHPNMPPYLVLNWIICIR